METKVPFYNVVNILLPGLVFSGATMFLFLNEIKVAVASISGLGSTGLEVLFTIAVLAAAYEVGYIIFRLGAALVEPALKKIFGWADYDDFVAAQKAGGKSLAMLSREYGYARTQITLFIALAIVTGIKAHWWVMLGCIILVVLFVITARGHMKKIRTTVDKYLSTNESEGTSNG